MYSNDGDMTRRILKHRVMYAERGDGSHARKLTLLPRMFHRGKGHRRRGGGRYPANTAKTPLKKQRGGCEMLSHRLLPLRTKKKHVDRHHMHLKSPKQASPAFRSCTGLTNPEQGAKAQSTAAKALDAILSTARAGGVGEALRAIGGTMNPKIPTRGGSKTNHRREAATKFSSSAAGTRLAPQLNRGARETRVHKTTVL